MIKVTVRADFFENTEDQVPFRTVIISASSEEEAVASAAAQMRDAARVEFERIQDRSRSS